MTRRAWLFMAITAAVWGASYMFIKIALDDGVRAPALVWIRVVFGMLVLLPIAWRRGALAGLRGHGRWATAVGAAQVAAPFILISYGEKWIPSSLAGILVASTSIFVVLLTPWLAQGDVPRGWAIVGLALGIIGVGLLFGVDLGDDRHAVLGGLMVLAASVMYAFASIWVRTKLSGVAPVATAAAAMAAASVMTLPAALAQPPTHMPSLGTWAALLALGAGGTGLAFLLYYTLIADIGVTRAAVVAYLAPLFAVGYGALFLDEAITLATIGGLVLILSGSYAAVEGRPPWRVRVPAPAPADDFA